MNVTHGDLLQLGIDGEFDVILHGCNCFNTMGSGIAAQIASKFPMAYTADQSTIKGDLSKLGNFTVGFHTRSDGSILNIVNCYTQFQYGSKGVHFRYDAFRECLRKVFQNYNGLRIGIPEIGCGLAGGDIERVKRIINAELVPSHLNTLVIYKK